MCAAVPVALLLLVVFAALTALRLSAPSPNARLLTRLHTHFSAPSPDSGHEEAGPGSSTPSAPGRAPLGTGKAETA
jgi:hypothetical protein